MKAQHYHILPGFVSRSGRLGNGRHAVIAVLLFIMAFLFASQSKAQDASDTVGLFTDSAYIAGDEEYQNKAGKFPDRAVLRSVPDSTVARMKNEKEFAYANDPAYWVKEKKVYQKGFMDYVFDFFQSDVVRWMFYIFLLGLIIFVLYRIIIVNDLFVIYSAKKHKRHLEDAAVTEIDPSIIDQRIQEAIDEKKYGAAVRYLYIKTLYTLSEKKWIQFHAQATNNEYVKQMGQHKNLDDFRFLTRVYEYVWYGKFEISEQQFSVVHHNFKKFQASI